MKIIKNNIKLVKGYFASMLYLQSAVSFLKENGFKLCSVLTYQQIPQTRTVLRFLSLHL